MAEYGNRIEMPRVFYEILDQCAAVITEAIFLII